MPIHWETFDWPSFATLTTGFAAVMGATAIGLKQAGIARRQADITERQVTIASQQNAILERQARLEEIRLRSELYDRRMIVYDKAQEFAHYVMIHGRPPTGEAFGRFHTALLQARFLFRPAVSTELLEFASVAFRFSLVQSKIDRDMDRGRDPSAEEYRTSDDLLERILQFSDGLPTLLRNELQLGEDDAHQTADEGEQ